MRPKSETNWIEHDGPAGKVRIRCLRQMDDNWRRRRVLRHPEREIILAFEEHMGWRLLNEGHFKGWASHYEFFKAAYEAGKSSRRKK